MLLVAIAKLRVFSIFVQPLIFDCPYELQELVTNGFYSKQFDSLTLDQKFVAYFYFLRQWKTVRIAALKDSSPRAIRKIKSAVEVNLQKPVYRYLMRRAERSVLTNTERAFLAEYGKAMEQPGFKGGIMLFKIGLHFQYLP